MFYLLANNTLACQLFTPGRGWFEEGPSFTMCRNITNSTVAEGSRSLSVTILPGTSTLEFLLFFEGVNHNITALHGRKVIESPNPSNGNGFFDKWVWEDLTDSLMPRVTNSQSDLAAGFGLPHLPNATFGAPFTSGVVRSGAYTGGGSDQSPTPPNSSFISVIFVCRNSDTVSIIYSHYANGIFFAGELLNPHFCYHNTDCGLQNTRTVICS